MARLTNREIENLGKVLNPKTKKAKELYELYRRAYDWCYATELEEVYEYHHSGAKNSALHYCKELERKCDSLDGCIVTYNIFQFTYAFTCLSEEGNTYLVYITKSYNYIVKLD